VAYGDIVREEAGAVAESDREHKLRAAIAH
jgi:hypothetical protein